MRGQRATGASRALTHQQALRRRQAAARAAEHHPAPRNTIYGGVLMDGQVSRPEASLGGAHRIVRRAVNGQIGSVLWARAAQLWGTLQLRRCALRPERPARQSAPAPPPAAARRAATSGPSGTCGHGEAHIAVLLARLLPAAATTAFLSPATNWTTNNKQPRGSVCSSAGCETSTHDFWEAPSATHSAPRRWPSGSTMGAAARKRSFGAPLTRGWSLTLQHTVSGLFENSGQVNRLHSFLHRRQRHSCALPVHHSLRFWMP
jgi:hypothetical protein